jgi:hypothetical protein
MVNYQDGVTPSFVEASIGWENIWAWHEDCLCPNPSMISGAMKPETCKTTHHSNTSLTAGNGRLTTCYSEQASSTGSSRLTSFASTFKQTLNTDKAFH